MRTYSLHDFSVLDNNWSLHLLLVAQDLFPIYEAQAQSYLCRFVQTIHHISIVEIALSGPFVESFAYPICFCLGVNFCFILRLVGVIIPTSIILSINMKKAIIGIFVLILFLASAWMFNSYNAIIALDQHVQSKWSIVEGQYQRRMDLIPNLVATVKGAANFEQETLIEVVNARAKATSITVDPTKLDADSISKYQAAQGELSTALGKLLVITENYPTLTATENFKDLQSQIEGTENRIAVSRKDFSDAVQTYNTKVSQFPGSIIAKLFGFGAKSYFKADVAATTAPTVAF